MFRRCQKGTYRERTQAGLSAARAQGDTAAAEEREGALARPSRYCCQTATSDSSTALGSLTLVFLDVRGQQFLRTLTIHILLGDEVHPRVDSCGNVLAFGRGKRVSGDTTSLNIVGL